MLGFVYLLLLFSISMWSFLIAILISQGLGNLIENIIFKSTKKMIYSQVLLLSGNSFFSCLFWSEILQGNQNLKWKEFVEFTKRQNIFYRFQIIFTFWGYDTCICYNEMFPNTFNQLLTFIIPLVYHQNLKLIKLCLIYLKLTTLFSIIALCRVIWLHYIFNFYYFRGFLMKIWHNNISSSIYHQY